MFSWFLTRNGRLFTHFSIGITSASVFATPLLIHGPLLHKYQSIFQTRHFGKPQLLDPDVLTRAEKVLSECDLNETQKQNISFFNVSGRDVCHAGGTNSGWGALIGLPFTFDAQPMQGLSELKIVGLDETVDLQLESPEFIEALSVSEKAQKFAIAREIYSANINHVAENAFVSSSLLVFIPAQISRRINKKYQTFRFPLRIRMLIYAASYSIGYLLYKCLKDPTKHLREKKCDEKVANFGPDYLMGGIQFYETMLSQNKELRQLLKERGESLYTKDGDENYFLLAPKLPITKRLEYLKKLQNEKQ